MNGRTNVTNSGNNIDVMEVPLDPVTNFIAITSSGKVFLSWSDPKDKYATPEGEQAGDPDQLVSVWSHTVIVRKEGSDPVDENDGVVVLSSSVRDQYSSVQYTDSNVENQVEYHYGAFAINEDGVGSEGSFQTVVPFPYDYVLNNNTWTQISDAGTSGVAQSMWEIGDEKEIMIGNSQYIVHIIDFNHDDLSDGSGKAAITFAIKYLMSDSMTCWERSEENKPLDYIGYGTGALKNQIESLTYNKMTNDLKSVIVPVNKTTWHIVEGNYSDSDDNMYPLEDSDMSVLSHNTFAFSEIEVMGTVTYSHEGEGNQYSYFTTAENRQLYLADRDPTDLTVMWALRSASGYYSGSNNRYETRLYYVIISPGGTSFGYPDYTNETDWPFCFGFCIGKSTV